MPSAPGVTLKRGPHRSYLLVKQLVEFVVIVSWIVVKGNQLLRHGQGGELKSLRDRAVPPAHTRVILLRGILRIMDQEVDSFSQSITRNPLPPNRKTLCS